MNSMLPVLHKLWIYSVLLVHGAPIIEATYIPVPGNENGEATIPCNHRRNVDDILEIRWIREGTSGTLASYNHKTKSTYIHGSWKDRVTFTVPHSGGGLLIRSIKLQDEANYRCHVDATTKNFVGYMHLNVLVKPDKPSITGADSVVQEGGNILVKCKLARVKPAAVITWTIQDNPPVTGITRSTKNTDGKTFMMQNIASLSAHRQQNGKILMCHVRWNNTADFITSTKTISVNYSPRSISLTGNGATTVRQGTLVNMTCQIDGGEAKPLPTLSIYRQGITNPVKIQDNTAQMTHTVTVQRDDSGKAFQCKATGGVVTGSIHSQLVIYYVLYPASNVTVTGVTGPVIEGSTVTLDCQAVNGNPNKYTYKWKYIDGSGQITDLPESLSRLTLSDIKFSANGRYFCEATNEYGPKAGYALVRVNRSQIWPIVGTVCLIALIATVISVIVVVRVRNKCSLEKRKKPALSRKGFRWYPSSTNTDNGRNEHTLTQENESSASDAYGSGHAAGHSQSQTLDPGSTTNTIADYENTRPEGHTYNKPIDEARHSYVNIQDHSVAAGEDYEQLRAEDITGHTNNQPRVYEPLHPSQ